MHPSPTPTDPFARGAAARVLLDGGAGSELRRRGAVEAGNGWMTPAGLAAPVLLEAIHADYRRAGARWATTATFGLTPWLLGGGTDSPGAVRTDPDARVGTGDAAPAASDSASGHGDGIDVEAIIAAAVGAARRAGCKAVAGAVSTAPPAFDARRWPAPEVEARVYARQIDALVAAGVDALVLEMVQDAEHGGRALAIAAERARGRPLWLGVSARPGRDGPVCFDFPDRSLGAVLDALLGVARPDALVLMHTPLAAIAPGLALLRERFDGPLAVRPELPYPEDGTAARRAPAEALALALPGWIDIAGGALQAVGGCCGTTPGHIAALAAAGV